ncbi:hypothetical protein [Streptosporangium sp. NPDC000396]|uniref:hypothetical protein n=1 Tax=Streptosporangium sp. NPDC000396 TaxID=3366185 RepID=UPI0036B8854B
MIKVRNALAAGTMVASALIVPATMPGQFAGAETVAKSAAASTLTSAEHPCWKHRNPARCRRRGHGGGGGNDGGGGSDYGGYGSGGNGGGAYGPSDGGGGGGMPDTEVQGRIKAPF